MKYVYNVRDKGIFGDSLEKAIKTALNRKGFDRVSPQGKEDFRYNNRHYEVKQNGTCIKYKGDKSYIMGSNLVIYATHIACKVFQEIGSEFVTVDIDLQNTEFYVIDKKAFLDFLLSNKGMVKYNAERGEYNIQSLYNYKRGEYIGVKGYKVEKWMKENALYDNEVYKALRG